MTTPTGHPPLRRFTLILGLLPSREKGPDAPHTPDYPHPPGPQGGVREIPRLRCAPLGMTTPTGHPPPRRFTLILAFSPQTGTLRKARGRRPRDPSTPLRPARNDNSHRAPAPLRRFTLILAFSPQGRRDQTPRTLRVTLTPPPGPQGGVREIPRLRCPPLGMKTPTGHPPPRRFTLILAFSPQGRRDQTPRTLRITLTPPARRAASERSLDSAALRSE